PLSVLHAPPPSELYTLSLHDALPIYTPPGLLLWQLPGKLNGIDHTQLFCLVMQPLHIGFIFAIPDHQQTRFWLTLPDTLQYPQRSEEHTSELQSRENLVCRLLLEKKK